MMQDLNEFGVVGKIWIIPIRQMYSFQIYVYIYVNQIKCWGQITDIFPPAHAVHSYTWGWLWAGSPAAAAAMLRGFPGWKSLGWCRVWGGPTAPRSRTAGWWWWWWWCEEASDGWCRFQSPRGIGTPFEWTIETKKTPAFDEDKGRHRGFNHKLPNVGFPFLVFCLFFFF